MWKAYTFNGETFVERLDGEATVLLKVDMAYSIDEEQFAENLADILNNISIWKFLRDNKERRHEGIPKIERRK